MIELFVTLLGLAGFAVWLAHAWPVFLTALHPRWIGQVRCPPAEKLSDAPRVCVIVPARNEEAAIRSCLESLVAQDYPNLLVIAVNDRSTDATGSIMDALAAAAAPRLRVLHVRELPADWLGKNHANWMAARTADADWLLFTDGDVLFQTDALRRAVCHAEKERLDHLCLFPGLLCEGWLEKAMVCFFGVLFSAATRTRQVRNPLVAGAFCGIGAFNLVRTAAYRAIGTHERLRLEVADDLKLGKLIKTAGFVSDVLSGRPQVTVRWQHGAWAVIRGLEKNGFAGSGFHIAKTTFGLLLLTGLIVMPIAGLFAPTPWMRPVFAVWLATQVGLLGIVAVRQGFHGAVGLAFPVAGLALVYAVGRSMVLATARGGIRWRDTFYPLATLRRGVV
jgi:hypothetical protein